MNLRIVDEPCCTTGACQYRRLGFAAGGVRYIVHHSVGVRAPVIVAEWQRLLDAATEARAWSAEFHAMAQTIEDAHAARVDAGATNVLAAEQTLIAALRENAADPPDGEDAFKYRLCMIFDWHPRQHQRDLDAAVTRARARKVTP